MVFAPQLIVAYFGGDYDNFTYPRYDLDFSIFRVYEDDKPLKTDHYFKWSQDGAKEGDPVFVIGNPGRTSRLLTISQSKFDRDYTYPYLIDLLQGSYDVYSKFVDQHPEKKLDYQTRMFGLSNSIKGITGYLSNT